MNIDRRSLLALPFIAAAAGCATMQDQPRAGISGIFFGQPQPQIKADDVSFELAVRDYRYRQSHLDRLVEEYIATPAEDESQEYVSASVDQVIYDHDYSRAQEDVVTRAELVAQDPRNLPILRSRINHDPLLKQGFYNFSGQKLLGSEFGLSTSSGPNPDILEYMQSPEALVSYADHLTGGAVTNIDQRSSAIAIGNPLDFGLPTRSKIYFFDRAYRDHSFNFEDGRISLPATEEKIISLLHHEDQHTQDYYQGIDLGNGLIIDNTNFHRVNRMVLNFVTQTRAGMREFEYTRNLIADPDKYIGGFHPAYIGTCFDIYIPDKGIDLMEQQLVDAEIRITDGEEQDLFREYYLTPFDVAVLRRQWETIKPLIEEATNVLEKVLTHFPKKKLSGNDGITSISQNEPTEFYPKCSDIFANDLPT